MKIDKEVVYTVTYNDDRDQFKMSETELKQLYVNLHSLFVTPNVGPIVARTDVSYTPPADWGCGPHEHR